MASQLFFWALFVTVRALSHSFEYSLSRGTFKSRQSSQGLSAHQLHRPPVRETPHIYVRSTALEPGSNGTISMTNGILAANFIRPTHPHSIPIATSTFNSSDNVSGGLLLSRYRLPFSSTAPTILKLANILSDTLCDVSRRRSRGFDSLCRSMSCFCMPPLDLCWLSEFD